MRMWSSGNVLFLILLAVALFAALSYAVTQSIGGGVVDISSEQSDLDTAKQQSIQANIDGALWRLKLINGCKDNEISYETPNGDNANPDAPGDNSCHVYHPDGGGVPYIELAGGECALASLEVGEACDGVVYAGESGGNRIYTTTADQGQYAWDNGSGVEVNTGALSNSDGLANTNTLILLNGGGAPYRAAEACRSLGQLWYLPAIDELLVLYNNRALIDGFSNAFYWTSRERGDNGAWIVRFNNGDDDWRLRGETRSVRCVRRD